MWSYQKSGQKVERGRSSEKLSWETLNDDYWRHLAVPVPVHAVPGPQWGAAQEAALGQVHTEDALTILQKLETGTVLKSRYSQLSHHLYGRLTGRGPAHSLLSALLHDQPLA